jgi:ribonuclease D
MQINSKYTLINNKKALELAVVNMANADIIAIDTESSGYFTYYSRVCLIQITVKGKNYLIDPLSQVDVKILNNIFNSPDVIKLFHSAVDDIKALKRDFGFEFQNIADTMYSSKLLGMEHNSLNYLVEYYHNIKMSKTEQKSNWEKRPLDREQLQYAALDTAYLESIWEKMKLELMELGLFEEAVSEFKKMTEEVYKGRESSPEVNWHKYPNILKFTGDQRRRIFDILTFREEKAKKVNKAPFRVLNNDAINKLVLEEPSEELLGRFFHNKKDISELLNLLKNPSGPPLEKSDFPKLDDAMTPVEEAKLRQLQKWRDKIIKKRGVDHSMLLSNKQFLHLIRNPPIDLEALKKEKFLSDWKIENYGPGFLKALKNEPYDEFIQHLKPIKQKKKNENKPIKAQSDSSI